MMMMMATRLVIVFLQLEIISTGGDKKDVLKALFASTTSIAIVRVSCCL
jgi:hypothetical protein